MKKTTTLRNLLAQPGAIVAPGVYDALGARVVQSVGFNAVYMTGNGAMASLLGKPDLALATMTEMVTRAHQIAACVDIPLICDADTGYGGLINVRRTVEEFEAAGVAGIHIEDQITQKRCGALGGVQLVSIEEASNRIETAANARRDSDFLIIARTDAKDVYGIDEAIHRVNQYLSAGADMAMVEGLTSLDEVKKVADSINGPLFFNIYERVREEAFSVKDLEAAGAKLIINCLTSTLYNAANLKKLYTEFKETGCTAKYAELMMPMSEYTDILGIERETSLTGSF